MKKRTHEQDLEKKTSKRKPAASGSDVSDQSDSDDESADTDKYMMTQDGRVPITHDALRMRARRLCEKKASGKCGVPENINADYVNGGESREILEMALLQCLGEFVRKVTVLKEKLASREQEVHGRWMTEERMRKCGEWSASTIKSMIAYCQRFPETLCRTPWGGTVGYNESITEYYIETDEKTTRRLAEIDKTVESTELDETWVKPDEIAGQRLADGLVKIPEQKPSPEVLGAKPVPELEKYMDSITAKTDKIDTMVAALENTKFPESSVTKVNEFKT
ncbi:unnamed protein product [Durusdinium trenchii]|uniref:Uncharacterized protein n=1 Tax=Durusdinium trenchii TaxID=1381693 RepID=A0ABP0PV75_9DINO